jgi:hypothetical protein
MKLHGENRRKLQFVQLQLHVCAHHCPAAVAGSSQTGIYYITRLEGEDFFYELDYLPY